MRIVLRCAIVVSLWLVLWATTPSAAALDLLPSPYDILRSRSLETPVLDAVSYCVPTGLRVATDPILELADTSEWQSARTLLADWAAGLDSMGPELVVLDAVLQARAVDDREGLLLAEERFRTLLRNPVLKDQRLCQRLELARVLLLLSRESEAAAQLTKAEQLLDDPEKSSLHRLEIDFWRAEILYRTHHPFEAHLAYRRLARADNARLALASRLRLTDLSFDAGKIDRVTAEYETLLPRASAFGASVEGWALRASEAALDAGDVERGLRWLESFLDTKPGRDARDTAEIRLADLDTVYDDALRARKRLSKISGRRHGDAIGALAAVRAIDLGVTDKSPGQRLELLLRALREQRHGVRRYALGVLMKELSYRGDLDGALAVATRLAYEGVDPVVTPGYGKKLDELLDRVARASEESGGCHQLVRALGGRYGILIERASKPTSFARVGACFEEMELPWLAARLYRTIARRFGALGAQTIALPLARSSLAIGEVTLARRVASAALEEEGGPPSDEVDSWKAIIAEADFVDGRMAEAATGLLSILDSPRLSMERGKLVRLLALTLEAEKRVEVANYIRERVPKWLDSTELEPAARASMIEAAMLGAHALRRSDQLAQAFVLYRTVERHAAQDSALWASARFWLGYSGQLDSAGEMAWGQDPKSTLGSPWGRLAQFEQQYVPLRDTYSGATR